MNLGETPCQMFRAIAGLPERPRKAHRRPEAQTHTRNTAASTEQEAQASRSPLGPYSLFCLCDSDDDGGDDEDNNDDRDDADVMMKKMLIGMITILTFNRITKKKY